ncbi:DNA-binding MarR family transcriptional regulator [Actinopolyspora biskrensis]|uniref:DNA-binding MarR family transcriptional regulator n=1 Tax=Actinopolyspora biskrensis TaxID=1470178 RepID=A0A852Z306_9ACTN|nr:DNA-binding MarR family transcriptional regulator [Actinopolyspora biskrensis]
MCADTLGDIHDAWRRARPDLDISSMEVFGRLKLIQALHETAVEPAFSGASLSPPEVDVLVLLRHLEEPIIARELARLRGCSRAAIGRILSKLDDRGLVAREPNPADRRAVLVRITELGCQRIDEVFPRQLVLEGRVLSSLTARQREQVTGALDLLAEALGGVTG